MNNHEAYEYGMSVLREPAEHTRAELLNALDTIREALQGRYGNDVIHHG